MTAIRAFHFDPLESLDELKSSGIEEKQARAFISLVKKSNQASFENLATREDLLLLKEDLLLIKEDLLLLDTKMDTVKSELKQDIALNEARFENKITEIKSEFKQDIADVKSELKQDIAEVKSELKQDIAGVKGELKQDIAEVKSELKQDIAEVKSELKQDITEIKQDIAGIKGTVNLLAKLFFGSVLIILVNAALPLLHHL